MIFGSNKLQRDLKTNANFVPKIRNIPIEYKNVTKFLGVLVDDQLSWAPHVSAIKSKMSRYVGILYKL